VAAVRRVLVVLTVALIGTAGCGVRTEQVPGAAAPITATGTVGPSSGPATPSPTAGSSGPTPAATPPVPVPTAFKTVTMTGSGLTISFPVPSAWTVTSSRTDELSRTDAKVGDELLLRVDLTARGTGTAREGAEAVEASIRANRPNYERLDIAEVPGVGDDAVDWTFTYDQAGTPAEVIDRQILSGPGGVAVYLRAPAQFYGRYLPVWQRTARELTMRTG
jgi:hypothetical protein